MFLGNIITAFNVEKMNFVANFFANFQFLNFMSNRQNCEPVYACLLLPEHFDII